MLFPKFGTAEPLPPTVLLLEQGTPTTPAGQTVTQSFRAKMDELSASSVYVYVESLGIALFGSPRYEEILRNEFHEKYRDKPIGVIVVRGASALRYALKLRDQIWPSVAIVFSGIDRRVAAEITLLPNVTGVTYDLRFENMVAAARYLVPNLKRLVLVGESLKVDSFSQRYLQDLPAIAEQLEIIDLSRLPFGEMKKRISSLPSDTGIAYQSLTRDVAGARFIPREALRALASVANRPIVVDTEATIGAGATGGFVMMPERFGSESAQIAFRVLNGESASNIPIGNGDNVKWVFDWRELQRWGIRDSQLPNGSEIRFRPPTAWEQYRWQIVTIAAVLAVQTALILGLLYEHRRRRLAEVSARNHMSELAFVSRRATMGELSASIGHEIKQPLAAIVSNADAALRFLGRSNPDISNATDALTDIVSSGHRAGAIIGAIQDIFRGDGTELSPVNVNDIVADVLTLLRGELARRKIRIHTSLQEPIGPVTANRVQLQQVVLNLIINAAEAMESVDERERLLRIESADNASQTIAIRVEDSGPGIDDGKLTNIFDAFYSTKKSGMGMGLAICRSLIESFSGTIKAENRNPQGATIVLELPAAQTRTANT